MRERGRAKIPVPRNAAHNGSKWIAISICLAKIAPFPLNCRMKLKERVLMVILGFSLALVLVLFFESAANDLNLGRSSVAASGGGEGGGGGGGGVRHGVIRGQRNLKKMASVNR